MAALSVADLKHVVIVDDEIDVYDAMEVEWAMATRVQADRDVTILSNARSKPLDPSLPLSEGIPTTAKCGIDATIPDGVPRARYQRITYPHADEADLGAYLGEAEPGEAVPEAAGDAAGASIEDAAAAIRELLAGRSMYFSEIAEPSREPVSSPSPGPWASCTPAGRSTRTPKDAIGLRFDSLYGLR